MAKILIGKGKKEFIKELNKEVVIKKPKKYFVGDISKDFHCREASYSSEF